MKRSIQTIKRRLGASRLSPDFASIQDTLRHIVEDIRVAKNSVTRVLLFELHFGRPSNTELSFAAERLSTHVNLDNQQMERNFLTTEQRREQCDSRPRIKLVKKGLSSPAVPPYFGGPTESVADTPHYCVLESLVHSANQWLTLKKSLSHQEGVKALRTLKERNQVLAATLCSNLSAGTLRFRNQMPAEQIRPSQPKRNLDYLVLNKPSKVEIFRKFLNRKSDRELFKPFKGKIVSVTGSTYITDKGKVIGRNHLAVRLKSTGLSFSGKQATPIKKGQKRPIVFSSSSTSPEDNRPLKPTSSRSSITAKTVSVPAHPQLPTILSSSTPTRPKLSLPKSGNKLVSEAPGIQAIPTTQDSTSVIGLTASSSTSGNQVAEVPISIKAKTPSPTKDELLPCPDLIPISSDDESSVPKLQECSSSNLATSGPPTRDVSGFSSDPDGNISSASNSSRVSFCRKKQTTFYGSPIRHSVNVIHASLSSPSTPVSPDRKVRFAMASQESDFQVGQSRVVSPNEAGVFIRKFNRFPSINSSDNPLRRTEK